jgi:hypothetical protein
MQTTVLNIMVYLKIIRACLEVEYFLYFLNNSVVFEILWYFSNTIFGILFKNSVFKIVVLAMLQYFHSFGNLAPDQSFQYRGKKLRVCLGISKL